MDGQVWRTIVHETFGALGYVDDEYQITAPLFAALSARTPAEKAGSLALLVDIKTRKHAPTYELDGSLHCYKWKGGAGTLLKDKNGIGMLNGKSGNSTGIGGGGDNESFTFKTDLMLVAKSWWDKNADGSPAEYARFTKLVKELGVEPLNRDQERLMLLFPIQLEFKKSRRTGKLTAYLLVDSLASDRGQNDSFWNSALDKVLGHVYHHMLPAKSKAEGERPAVYGRELAKNRGLSDDEDLLQGFQGPFFGKNKQ